MSGNTLLENTSSSAKKEDLLLLAVLLGFTFFFRLYMLQMINVGPDEIDYWFSAKQLSTGGTYPEIMHRTIRWSIILPAAFFQLILGIHPLVYYVTPVLNSLVQTVLLYNFGKKLFGRGVAFYSVLILAAWPYMWRTGSQIRPAIFSLTYVLVAIYALFLFLQTDLRRYFSLSVIFLFLAYQSKITNLYFVPGILIVLWIQNRRMAESLRYGASLFGLYLIEHMAYWVFTGDKMGRLGIIAGNHLASGYAEKLPKSLWGLSQRYTVFLDFPWHVLLLAFVAATLFLLVKKRRWVLELTVLHVSFFFFLTFMVKSIDPVVPVEAFLDRYFIVNLPTMSLIIVYALFELLPLPGVVTLSRKGILVGTASAVVIVSLTVTALPLPDGVEKFYTPFSKLELHPIPRFFEFERMMDLALQENLPIISVDSEKPLDTANRVFYDNPHRGRSVRSVETLKIDGHNVYYLDGVGGAPQSLDLSNGFTRVLWCDRFNFDMIITTIRDIPKPGDTYEQ